MVQSNNFFSLEQVIDRHPLQIAPDLPLIEVIRLMQEWGNSCYLSENIEHSEVSSLAQLNNSCALIVVDSQLRGIFSERDLVHLVAERIDISKMTVEEVMSRELITLTLTGSEDIFTALNLLRQHHIRHLPIIDARHQLLGLVTEKNIRQNLQPINLMKWRRVEEIMTTVVAHAPTTASVRQVAQVMARQRISCVAMVEKQEYSELLIPQGILTERDIVQFQNLSLDLEQPAQKLMSSPLFLVSPQDSLWSIHQLMKQRRVRRLLVAGDQGELVGIITQSSLLQVFDPTEMYEVIEGLQRQVCQLESERAEFWQQRTASAEAKILEQAALLDVATDAILVRGLDGQILFWNRGAEKLYGWRQEEALEQDANQLLYQESCSELSEIQQLVTEKDRWQGELQQVTKAGQEIVVLSRWTLVKDEGGNPQSLLVVNTDITEKKQLENQFLRAQRLESLGTLASGIAHDLNNILTPILAVTQILPSRLPSLDQNLQELLSICQNNVRRGADLVQQILTFTRGAEGEKGIIQVKHLIGEIKQISKQAFPKTMEIQTNLSKNLWTVNGNATQIHQVLMNLAVNARDAMANGGTLGISAENLVLDPDYERMYLDAREGKYILITVSDTGVGIPADIQERVFEPFFTTKQIGHGTGLGLATVLGIVKNHGGFIDLHSQVGQGSQFRVFLPAVETTATVAEEIEELPRGNGELILVVDDEAPIRAMSKTILETYNYRVLTANDGIEAIALYSQHQNEFEVVLMDMMMPLIDGQVVIRTLQKMKPQVKIIAVSGLVTKDISTELKDSCCDCLAKPYTTEALLTTIHRVILSRNSRR